MNLKFAMNPAFALNSKLALLVPIALAAAGCYVRVRPATYTVTQPNGYYYQSDEEVYVDPPPDQVEVITVQPSPAHVWVRGSWRYESGRYVWGPGYWTVPPRGGAVWVHGGWVRGRRGWVYHRGTWR